MNKIIERIEREAGVPDLVSILAERLSPTDLQSLLLEVYHIRSKRIEPSGVLSDYEANRFVQPSALSPRSLLRWEEIAFSHLPDEFQPIALSPVCPLGTNSAVAPVNQNWAVTTVRNTEAISDSTNVLALECSLRRRALLRADPKSSHPVHLATSHRLLRGQHYQSPELLPHFSSFALCSAGRDKGNLLFELSALEMHARFYLRSLRAFVGLDVRLHLSVSNFGTNRMQKRIDDRLLSGIRSDFMYIECVYDGQRTSGRGYYHDLCFKIHATATSGQKIELVDGGSVDWTQKLLSNAKERLLISGIGSERLVQLFGGDHTA
jgi:hypothetical protein